MGKNTSTVKCVQNVNSEYFLRFIEKFTRYFTASTAKCAVGTPVDACRRVYSQMKHNLTAQLFVIDFFSKKFDCRTLL